MIMTWTDYIFLKCGISLTIILIMLVSFVVVYSRDKKKRKNIKPINKDFFDWRELK
jgi:hypothetical protein